MHLTCHAPTASCSSKSRQGSRGQGWGLRGSSRQGADGDMGWGGGGQALLGWV